MAMCRICLETNENSIDIAGIEGVQLNIGKIVYQYISFCFEVNDFFVATIESGFRCVFLH